MVWSLLRLQSARREFARRPAFAQWHAWAALPDAETIRDALRRDGIEVRPLESSLRALDEAAGYAQAALDGRAWDAATVDLDRAIAAMTRIAESLGMERIERGPRIPRGTVLRTIRGSVLLLIGNHQRVPFAAWRRIDVALSCLAQARRMDDPDRIRYDVRTLAHPDGLRTHVRRAVSNAHRDVRAEAKRLLNEAEETADYALAAFEARAWPAARIDLDRLDAALRALRHIVQRESEVYLPEPWSLRLPTRLGTAWAMRREARAARSLSREDVADIEANVAAMTARATEAQARRS